MPLQKPLAGGAPRRAGASARSQRPKGNGHTELSASELEQMLFEAARMRAANVYRGDPRVMALSPRRKQ
jgi:hypothetical protein